MLCCLLINLTCGISAGIKHIAMCSYRKLIHYRRTTVTALCITPHRHALFSYYNTYPCFIPYLLQRLVKSDQTQINLGGRGLYYIHGLTSLQRLRLLFSGSLAILQGSSLDCCLISWRKKQISVRPLAHDNGKCLMPSFHQHYKSQLRFILHTVCSCRGRKPQWSHAYYANKTMSRFCFFIITL